MVYTERALDVIANKARLLSEYFCSMESTGVRAGGENSHDDEQLRSIEIVETWLAQWCENAAKGDWDAFVRRLDWDGLTLEHALTLLSNPNPVEHTDHPWLETLRRVMREAAEVGYSPEYAEHQPVDAVEGSTSVPYEWFVVPFTRVARENLKATLPTSILASA